MLISEIVWGDDSAEKDPNLLEYFVSHSALKRLQACGKSIIVGRKGSGKSAVRTKLIKHFDELGYIVVETSPSYNIINSIVSNKDVSNNFDDEIFFQYTWLRHLLHAALIKIGTGAKGKFTNGSLEYARNLSINSGQTQKDLLESLTEILSKIKVKAGTLGDLGLNIESILKSESEVSVLEHHIKELTNEGYKIVFIVDDLDLGWNNSKTANNLLLGLLTSINYLKLISHNLHSFICIREDVYRILLTQTQHSDKYRDIEILKWNTDSLKTLLDERICFNYRKNDKDPGDDPFLRVFPQTVGTSNTINWLIERTLSRPRELLQISRLYTESNETDEPDPEILKEVELIYSNWKLDDLCTEFKYQYPGLEKVFGYWKTKYYRHKYHLKKNEIEEILFNILLEVDCDNPWFIALKNNADFDTFLNILYRIGFIGDFILGGQGGSKIVYSISDVHEPIFNEIQVHPCFRKAMGTIERIRSKD